jgi:hypothetical protein
MNNGIISNGYPLYPPDSLPRRISVKYGIMEKHPYTICIARRA